MQAQLHAKRAAAASSASCRAPQVPSAPRISAATSRQGRGRRCAVVVRADGDYYSLLGVERNSDKKTIKQAYRQKARKYHPVSFRQLDALMQ